MGAAWGWIARNEETISETTSICKTRRVPTISYHEIRMLKMDLLDIGDIRTSTRNSINDIMSKESDLEIDFKYKDNRDLWAALTNHILPDLKAITLARPTFELSQCIKFMK